MSVRPGERGQTTVLTLGYVVAALLLVAVVVNVSRVFLVQRSLDAAADGAAVAAVQAVRTDTYYGDGAHRLLPLDAERARSGAVAQLAASRATEACEDFRLDEVDVTRDVVSVTVSCRVRIPFAAVVAESYADGVPLTSTASALMRVAP